MIISKMALPRRTFLRGLGATLSLPLLDAMVPALSTVGVAAAAPVRRLGFVYIPMGSNPAVWTPAELGRLTTLSPSLASLSPYLEHLTVFTNLELKNANTTGNHASSNAGFLSCARAKRTESSDYENGTTVDQIAATAIGRETPIPSLELGVDLDRPGRQLRQRLRLCLSEQPVVVVADHAAPDRGRSARRLRTPVRGWRLRRTPACRAQEERQHPRLGDGRHGQPAAAARGGRQDESRPVPRHRPRGRAAHSARGAAERRLTDARARSAAERARGLGGTRGADVRPAGARAAVGPHARDHVPAGAREQHAHVPTDWRARAPSPGLASLERSREVAQACEDQRVPRVALRASCSRS